MALSSHTWVTRARNLPKSALIAAPVAVAATVSAVSLGVVSADSEPNMLASQATGSISQAAVNREPTISRSEARTMGRAYERKLDTYQARQAAIAERRATRRAVENADSRLWTSTLLDVWTESGKDAEQVGLLKKKRHVLVTGREADGRTEIVQDGKSRWVTSGYLVAEKPHPPKPEPTEETEEAEPTEDPEPSLGGACTNGTSVSGQPNVLAVHEAVCAAFPSITSYGTYRGDGEHAQGIAIDIMVSGSTGWEVAEFVRANASELGVSYVIYAQNIWSVERSSEGWRPMEDRGSTTANHYDHVHVTTY